MTKEKIHLETMTLTGGVRIVRPRNACGSCGFHPKAWNVGVMRRRDTMIGAFLKANRNWSREDIAT